MYKTDIATDDEIGDWNNIISRCPYSEALHTLQWRNALQACFRQLEPIYFIIREDENIIGALPCFVFRPIPTVRMLLSMPWALPGGPLIFPAANVSCGSATPAPVRRDSHRAFEKSSSKFRALEKLEQRVLGASAPRDKTFSKSFKAQKYPGEAVLSAINCLERISRQKHSSEITVTLPADGYPDINNIMESAGYLKSSTQFTHILDTSRGYDSVWDAYNKRVRGAVRKAQKAGVFVKETEEDGEMMGFYKLYISAMAHFNSTPKPYQLLRYLQKSSIARLVVAQLDNRIIGGLLFLHFNSCVRLWCEASDPDFLSYRPNNAVIDYIIQWACERGYSRVDFGASPIKSKGLVAFKEEWRAQKVWFYTFTKVSSLWKRKIWILSEPALRRLYGTIQKFRIRSI